MGFDGRKKEGIFTYRHLPVSVGIYRICKHVSKGHTGFWRRDCFTRRVCTLSVEGNDDNDLCMV